MSTKAEFEIAHVEALVTAVEEIQAMLDTFICGQRLQDQSGEHIANRLHKVLRPVTQFTQSGDSTQQAGAHLRLLGDGQEGSP